MICEFCQKEGFYCEWMDGVRAIFPIGSKIGDAQSDSCLTRENRLAFQYQHSPRHFVETLSRKLYNFGVKNIIYNLKRINLSKL